MSNSYYSSTPSASQLERDQQLVDLLELSATWGGLLFSGRELGNTRLHSVF